MTLATLDLDVPVVLDELLAVVLDDEVVVVHHDGERLADDEREPHADVARALTDVDLDPARDEDQGDLGNSRVVRFPDLGPVQSWIVGF